MQHPAYFVHILGFAGSGKLTIAKQLAPRLPAILVDNHFINNVVLGLIDPDGITPLAPDVWVNIRKVRAVVLETILNHAKPGRSFVFTNEILEGEPLAEQACSDLAKVAKARGATYFPVRLFISPEELALRVASPERVSQLKEVDAEAALTKAQTRQVFKPRNHECQDIVVTNLSPIQAAEIIALHVRTTEA
jgi:predicted kinase